MVSVVVPVYNMEKYLVRSLDALVHQTLKELEIIAVDDGSTDASPRILSNYQKKYPGRIKVYTKKNGGQASARNLGISKCTGDYIGFADSDDVVDRTMYEKMYDLAVKEEADLVECRFHFIEEKDHVRRERKARGNVRQYHGQKDMFIDPQVSPWNKLYRRRVLEHTEIRFPQGYIYEDTAFYIKSIPYVHKTAFLNQKLVTYFLRENSTINGNRSERVGDIFEVLKDILGFYRRTGYMREFNQELEYFCVKIAFCSSFSRIGRIQDRDTKLRMIKRTFQFVNSYFPHYRSNPYFTGKIGTYIRFVHYWNSPMISSILGQTMKG